MTALERARELVDDTLSGEGGGLTGAGEQCLAAIAAAGLALRGEIHGLVVPGQAVWLVHPNAVQAFDAAIATAVAEGQGE